MKIQKAFRMRAMWLVGLGVALLLATPARAQQDMDPTYFDVNPGAPNAKHKGIVRTARDFNMTEEQAMLAQSPADLPDTSNTTLESGLLQMTLADSAAIVILFGGVVLIVLYAMAATRRERQPQVLLRPSYSPTHGASVR
jgi:hypothetical protein